MKDRPVLLYPLLALAAGCSSTHAPPDTTARGPSLLEYSAPRGGFVSAAVGVFGDRSLLSVGATFWAPENAGAGVECSAREIGRCSVRSCEAAIASRRSLTSGTISILADGASAASLEPDPAGHYPNPAGKARKWSPGARIHLESRGGDVPAFAADLMAPTELEVVEPAARGPLALDRAAGFPVRWISTPAEGDVRVAIRQERTSGKTALEAGVAVDCFFARSEGHATIPPEALTDLTTSLPANAMVYSVTQSHARAGEFDTVVLVNTGGVFREVTIQ